MHKVWVLLLAALTWASAGCTVTVTVPETKPVPRPAEAGHVNHTDTELEAPQAPPPEPAPLPVKLVPIDPIFQLPFEMLVPEGWQVSPTVLKDNVQILHDGVTIMVGTYQLRERPAPRNEEEMRAFYGHPDPSDIITQIHREGVLSAFEVRSTMSGDPVRQTLTVHFFGTTWTQRVSLWAPSAEFDQWEPMFREMVASFKNGNLNSPPQPGRP